AAQSDAGQQFCAKYSDILFASSGIPDYRYSVAAKLRAHGREFGREVQIYTSCTAIVRPTEKEARDFWQYCVVEEGDHEAAEKFLRKSPRVDYEALSESERAVVRQRWIAGKGGYQMVGTPDQVADMCLDLRNNADFDGTALAFMDFETDLKSMCDEVVPR